MEIHAAAQIFPMMTDDEFAGLVEDIREHGLREPIVLFEGKVLDGRNRLKACEQLGVEPSFEEWPNGEDPHFYVVSKNLHRRHLSESQRAMVAARIASATGREGLKHVGERIRTTITNQQAADQLNIGRNAVVEAKKVITRGTPEEIEAVESGHAAVSRVAKEIRERDKARGEAPHPEQVRAAGPKITCPEGMTLEQRCREGLEHEAAGASGEDVAADFGINARNYRMVRDIVLLSDRDDLSERDKAAVADALRKMNETGRVKIPHKSVASIVERIWGTHGQRQRGTDERRLEQFERAFGHVIQVGMSADQIDIPYITEDRAQRAIHEIADAIKHMRNLKSRLEELYR